MPAAIRITCPSAHRVMTGVLVRISGIVVLVHGLGMPAVDQVLWIATHHIELPSLAQPPLLIVVEGQKMPTPDQSRWRVGRLKERLPHEQLLSLLMKPTFPACPPNL